MAETEDKPDLDELLERLGEPDDESRRRRIPGSVWLMLALVLSLAGVWLALRTAMGTAAALTIGPPVLPTKIEQGPPRDEHAEPVDVVEDYMARCKKGMTAQEVRWIIEDFQKAGLDDGPGSLTDRIRESLKKLRTETDQTERPLVELEAASLDLARRQRVWYLETLKDGLRLNADQMQTVGDRLTEIFEGDQTKFRKRLKAFGLLWDSARSNSELSDELASEIEKLSGGLLGLEMFVENSAMEFALPEVWLKQDGYAPWKLCELTVEQKRLTYHGYLIHYGDDSKPWFSPDGFGCTNPKDEHEGNIGDFPTGEAPAIGEASAIFPFYSFQSFAVAPGSGRGIPLGEQAMRCHPDQLKTLLLVKPEAASRLLEVLDAAEN